MKEKNQKEKPDLDVRLHCSSPTYYFYVSSPEKDAETDSEDHICCGFDCQLGHH
jgi:hypothetical protein